MAVLLFLLWIIWNGKVNAEILLFVFRFFCVIHWSLSERSLRRPWQ